MPVNVGAVRVPQFGGRVMVSAFGSTGAATYDSGIQFMDAMEYPRFSFQLLGTFTGFIAQFFGCNDPQLYNFYLNNIGSWQGAQIGAAASGTPVQVAPPPASSWFALGAPADQGGTGTPLNPLTAAGQYLETRQPVLAVRCVLTAAAGSTGQCTAVGVATV